MLHNGVIDRNMLTFGEFCIDCLLFVRRIINIVQRIEYSRYFGFIPAESIFNRPHIPQKNSGIPIISPCRQISFCRFQIRFFFKSFHLPDYFCSGFRTVFFLFYFYITIPGFRTGRPHPYSQNPILAFHKIYPFTDHPFKFRHIHHDMIGRRDNQIRLRIFLFNLPGCIGNTRSRITHTGLEQYIGIRDSG